MSMCIRNTMNEAPALDAKGRFLHLGARVRHIPSDASYRPSRYGEGHVVSFGTGFVRVKWDGGIVSTMRPKRIERCLSS